jgi:hypothetical protein
MSPFSFTFSLFPLSHFCLHTKTTTFNDPRIELSAKGASKIPQYQRNFKYKLMYLRQQYCQEQRGQCKIPVSRNNLFHDS